MQNSNKATLLTPIEKISKIGPQYQKRLKRLGIETVEQLIFHFPHRYQDFSKITPVKEVEIEKTVCLKGEIKDIRIVRLFKKRMQIIDAKLKDSSGEISVVWFNQPYLASTFKKGDFVFLAGKIVSKKGKKYLSSPSYEKIINEENPDLTHTGRIIPIYPETEGMSSRWLRFIVKPLLGKIKNEIKESLPQKEVLEKNNLLNIKEAIWQIHFPDSLARAEEAKKRFVFEELFNLSLIILSEKMKLNKERAINIEMNVGLIKSFVEKLPFSLTADQKKAAWQILKDLEKTSPMNRLLNGDVGSGKTIVALLAILNTAEKNLQTAFMAPTEILAKQHFETVKKFLKNNKDRSMPKIKVGLITAKENFIDGKKITRKEILEKIKTGKCQVIIGTHALIQEKVEFKKLALIIIDEQHRFGIDQRARLCRKQNFLPHLLSMSATPIPRTLTLTLYGDLDLSIIKEMPEGRKKVITEIIKPEKRKQAYGFVRKEIKAGRQAFVICPRIEPSNSTDEKKQQELSWFEVKAVKQEYEKLSKDIFPDLKIAMLHGKMKTDEKEKTLKGFRDKKIDIIVATSVIEVGIDFPNATIMIIEGAEKFGLAQLHQFRGRVGRGKDQSYCFLFSELGNNPRLKAMKSFEDGFKLAEKDLALRGPGDLTGQRQWGLPDFVMASLKNIELIEKTRQAAKEILTKDPELKKYPLLKNRLKKFQRRIHLE